MKKIIIFFLSVFTIYSCKCDADIKIGEFKLTEKSKQFIPYSGDEILIFEDNLGMEHILKSIQGKELRKSRLSIRTPCSNTVLDYQEVYYDTQNEQIVFYENEKQAFNLTLTTSFEDNENGDSIAIYDNLIVDGVINGNFVGQIKIITEERQNYVSPFHRNEFFKQSEFIGDTILFSREFKNVYKESFDINQGVYYNKEKGVIAYEFSEDEFWVLKN